MISGRDMIVPIKHRVDWELIFQQKQTQINRDNTQDYRNKVDYYYKFRDKIILTNNTAYKYETPYKCPLVITHKFNNGKVMLQCGAIKTTYNIRRINP